MKSARPSVPKPSSKVLFVNHTGKVSGAEAVLLQMLAGLDRTQYQPVLLCGREGSLTSLAEELGVRCEGMEEVLARFTTHPVRMLYYMRSIFNAIMHIRSSIIGEQPALVHANTVRSGIVCTIATFGMRIPVIWHVHDILPPHPITRTIQLLLQMSTSTRALCVSQATALALSGACSFRSRVTVLHNGVDLQRFPAKNASPGFADESSAIRTEIGLSEKDFVFCSVGQIAPRKGLLRLIKVFSLVQARIPHAHLLVIGEAVFNQDYEYQTEVVALTQSLGLSRNVHFLGRRSDVPLLMRSSDAFVMFSSQEPFGLVLVEAMSSGIVVIASRVGGIPEIVDDNETGLLVSLHDDKACAECMLHIISDTKAKIRLEENALSLACPRFTVEKFLNGLHQYYSLLLDPDHERTQRWLDPTKHSNDINGSIRDEA